MLGTQQFEAAEGGHEEARLPDQAFGAAIVGGARFQHAQREPLESVDVLLVPLEGVVEVENLDEQSRAKAEWRLGTVVARLTARHSEKRFAFRGTQHRGGGQKPFG